MPENLSDREVLTTFTVLCVTGLIRMVGRNKENKSVRGVGSLSRSGGFSILEMMVTVAIASLLAAAAIPQYVELQNSFERSMFIQQLDNDIRRARSEAQAQGMRGILAVSEEGTEYSIGTDGLPTSESATPDTIVLTRDLGSRNTVSLSDSIIFDGRGFLVDSDGEPTTITVTLSRDGEEFCSGSVYPVGAFIYTCGGGE
ncbi:MAG: GspH/FimT family protein [Bdellovibrionales bacterium]|nr:GspH/FimT family protein [Bdellovibrionales bacterium]